MVRDFASYSQSDTPPSHKICGARAGFRDQDFFQLPGVGQFASKFAGVNRIKAERSQLHGDDFAGYFQTPTRAEDSRELLLPHL
jgi:hypothetical protein